MLNAKHFTLVKVESYENSTHCIPGIYAMMQCKWYIWTLCHFCTIFTSDLTYSISVLRKRSQHDALSVVGYFPPSLVKLLLTVDRIYFIDTMKRFQIGSWIRDVIESTHDCLRAKRSFASRTFPFPISDDYFTGWYRVLIPDWISKHEARRFHSLTHTQFRQKWKWVFSIINVENQISLLTPKVSLLPMKKRKVFDPP